MYTPIGRLLAQGKSSQTFSSDSPSGAVRHVHAPVKRDRQLHRYQLHHRHRFQCRPRRRGSRRSKAFARRNVHAVTVGSTVGASGSHTLRDACTFRLRRQQKRPRCALALFSPRTARSQISAALASIASCRSPHLACESPWLRPTAHLVWMRAHRPRRQACRSSR